MRSKYRGMISLLKGREKVTEATWGDGKIIEPACVYSHNKIIFWVVNDQSGIKIKKKVLKFPRMDVDELSKRVRWQNTSLRKVSFLCGDLSQTYCYNWWKLICERTSAAWHADSLSVSIHTRINTHEIRGRGPTTLSYSLLSHEFALKYDCQHAFANYYRLFSLLAMISR